MFGIKMIKIEQDQFGYLGSKDQFIQALEKKTSEMREPHVLMIKGELCVFEGKIPEIEIPTPLFMSEDFSLQH